MVKRDLVDMEGYDLSLLASYKDSGIGAEPTGCIQRLHLCPSSPGVSLSGENEFASHSATQADVHGHFLAVPPCQLSPKALDFRTTPSVNGKKRLQEQFQVEYQSFSACTHRYFQKHAENPRSSPVNLYSASPQSGLACTRAAMMSSPLFKTSLC